MPELISPTSRLHLAWLAARDEWGRGVHQDGSGLHTDDDVDSPEGFAAWVDRLCRSADTGVAPEPGRVHCTYRWIVEDDTVLGAIALRHELNDFLLRAGGHIGYGIRPGARRRGLATFALGEVLGQAKQLGLERALITCNVANEASRRTIERHGGALEDIRDTELGRLRRYWISL
ncbi:GNAT family N-acetyltransferase [Krasilnikovia sp. M28-CT-15]|uniref:GNAT family N-acetyltransferase n=1 Tax=Krasilnikovia sp. M28-CT-15 TaxID=3373540 RepID=UPI003876FC24